MMRGRGMADADAAAQQDRHLEPAAAHVLNFGDLVDDLAGGVEDKIREHEIDHRARPGHGGATAKADKAALANGRVAETLRSVKLVQARGGLEVATSFADPFAHDEDLRIA